MARSRWLGKRSSPSRMHNGGSQAFRTQRLIGSCSRGSRDIQFIHHLKPVKIKILLATLGLFACVAPAATPVPAFSRADLMRIGVYYYPEAWPSNQWARDIANIKKLNLEFVHMGEFAWAFMEPEEGKFDFEWLDRNIQLCAEQGLKVVLRSEERRV